MNLRRSLKSLHNYQQTKCIKKTIINQDDLKQCNQYFKAAQSTNQSENSILSKLLLQPPSLKIKQSQKGSVHNNETKKYDPVFTKPDAQSLIQQNINLKNIVQKGNQTINILKIKNSHLQKKIKLLQKGIQKIQKQTLEQQIQNQANHERQNKIEKKANNQSLKTSNIQNGFNVQNGGDFSFKQSFQFKNIQNLTQKKIKQNDMNKMKSGSVFCTTGIVHTEILKKKIHDLTNMYAENEKQLKFLKTLPASTIYQQNDVQKQHLIAETIRLKAVITSLSQGMKKVQEEEKDEKFQNQFMRLMKEQNQKLKATIRLLENDKILLKSRQTIQNKLNSDLKKQIQHLKQKLLYKQSQLQKLNNENKNLLFKKTTQFRQQQQKKQSQQISQLKLKLVRFQTQNKRLQQSNEYYSNENTNLKEKEKNLAQQLNQLQSKYEKVVKNLNQQLDQLQFESSNLKNDYLNLLNSGNLKKKKSMTNTFSKQTISTNYSSNLNINYNNSTIDYANLSTNYNGTKPYSNTGLSYSNNLYNMSGFNNVSNGYPKLSLNNVAVDGRQGEQQEQQYNMQKNSQKYNLSNINDNTFSQPFMRVVKWQDINLALMQIYSIINQQPEITVEAIINNIKQQEKIRCIDLVSLLIENPFNLQKKQAIKFARFITEDDCKLDSNGKFKFNLNKTVSSTLARQIFSSCLQKFNEKAKKQYENNWFIILQKNKKIISSLQEQFKQQQIISKDRLIELCQKCSRKKITYEEYQWLIIKCFDRNHSAEQIYIDTRRLIQLFRKIVQKGKNKTQQVQLE